MRTVSACTTIPSSRAVQSVVCFQRKSIVLNEARNSAAICSGATPMLRALVLYRPAQLHRSPKRLRCNSRKNVSVRRPFTVRLPSTTSDSNAMPTSSLMACSTSYRSSFLGESPNIKRALGVSAAASSGSIGVSPYPGSKAIKVVVCAQQETVPLAQNARHWLVLSDFRAPQKLLSNALQHEEVPDG